MKAAKGYYSLIQYCPDLSRLEAANVGVLLFCPELPFIGAMMDSNNARVRQFFGQEAYDRRQLDATKDAFVHRLEVDRDLFQTVSDLEQFIATRANELQLTALRPMKVFDPANDLKELFGQLVAEGPAPARRAMSEAVREALSARFAREGLGPFIEPNPTVHVRALDKELTVPFGYRNGRFNLVRPAAFLQRRIPDVISDACVLAVEGHSIYQHPDLLRGEMQLVVVAQFAPSPGRATGIVREVFSENDVVLHDIEDLGALIQHIRESTASTGAHSPANASSPAATTA